MKERDDSASPVTDDDSTPSGVEEHPHSGSWPYDHLVGTRDLLAEWGDPHHLAVAGLFHSIYGTESYKITSVALERRREVAECIGDEAEALAFVFCVSHRADFLTQLGRGAPTVKDVVHATEIALTPDDLQQLIELEVANCVEQIYPERVKPSRVPQLKRMLHAPISEGARVSLEDLISKCETTLATASQGGKY